MSDRPISVGVVGMGYVGAVSAAALASRGCRVVGVESNPTKLALLKQGRSPVSEPGVEDALSAASTAGTFTATPDITEAVRKCDVVMICVGTPSGRDGKVNLDAVDRVIAQTATALAGKQRSITVMVRSTVPPGTVSGRLAPVLHQANPRTVVCHHPEFLREGSAMKDWARPPMIVWGAQGDDVDGARTMIESLYDGIAAPRLELGTVESEMMKYACNVFHAIKIDFANEIGTIAAACGADPAQVMAAFCCDTRLNISPAYLRPGFAFGGSCLPKDTRAMLAAAREHNIDLPLLSSVLDSNAAHLRRAVDRVLDHGRKPTLLLGLSFKVGTDDLRESPLVDLAEALIGKGVPLTIHDPDLMPDRLIGANARYVAEHLPHLQSLLTTGAQETAADAQVVVIGKHIPGLDALDLRGKVVIDLTAGPGASRPAYESPATIGSIIPQDDEDDHPHAIAA